MLEFYTDLLDSTGLDYSIKELKQCVKHHLNQSTMKKCICFSRVSTLGQHIESQANELKNEANRCGYSDSQIVKIEYHESAIKLDIDERQGIQHLKRNIESDPDIECVFVYEISRLSRQNTMLFQIRDYLIEHNIQLVCLKPYMRLLDDDGKMSQTASILFSLFSSISESEMMIKKERFMRAKNYLKEQNKKFAGAVVFGYMKDEMKHCVPHPLHSKIIMELYDHYVNTDASLYETYKWAEGKWPEVFPYREYIRAGHKIGHLLRNELYSTGNWCYPPLVSREIYQRAIEKMDNSRCQARYKNTRELLCRGKIYCAECGHVMTPSGGNTKAYVCPTDKKHSCQISFDIADWIMWEETRSLINLNSALDMRSKVHEIEEMLKIKESIVGKCKSEINKCKLQMDKLLDVYMKGIIQIEQFEPKMEELKQQQTELEKEADALDVQIRELRITLEATQSDLMRPKFVNVDLINDFEARLEFVRKYISKMEVEKVKDEYRTFIISFEYLNPIIASRCKYKYVFKNQNSKKVYRINEDESEELVFS